MIIEIRQNNKEIAKCQIERNDEYDDEFFILNSKSCNINFGLDGIDDDSDELMIIEVLK